MVWLSTTAIVPFVVDRWHGSVTEISGITLNMPPSRAPVWTNGFRHWIAVSCDSAGTTTTHYFGNALTELPKHANFADKSLYDTGDLYFDYATPQCAIRSLRGRLVRVHHAGFQAIRRETA